jgi:imidazolonepropionase-like amidohydrolase
MRTRVVLWFSRLLLSAASIAATAQGLRAQGPATVYRGATVLTAAKGEIPEADLLVRGGKIIVVGKRGDVAIPDGAEIVNLGGKVIIPGLVDTHSHIGIYPRPSVEAHEDGNEATGAVQPGLRALDAIWPDDPGIPMALAGGVTTANIMPGSANAIGGQTLYVKLRGRTIDAMMVTPGKPEGGLKLANGENPKRTYGAKGQAPATRMRLAAMQREQFLKAREYLSKWQQFRAGGNPGKPSATEPDRDPALEALAEAMERRRTVHFHSHRADDILTAVRLSEEFGFELVLQHGTEAYKVADELARRRIPVSLTLPDSPGGKPEVLELIEQNAALLVKAGVTIAINTDDSITESRFLLRTAAHAVRGGLSEEAALLALTRNAAEMLHLGHRVGSIEAGKDADFVVLSGRPFSVYTQVLQTYIEGEKRYDRFEGTQGNYAVGGFALPDPVIRPRPPVAATPQEAASKPTGGQVAVPVDAKRVAVRAGILYPASGPPIRDGAVLIEGGKVVAVGKQGAIKLPDGTPILTTAVATPGLVDAHTVVGISGWLNAPADQDQDEKSDPNQADLRVLDGFNPEEPLLGFALRHGVTVIQAFPGRADVIAGQAGIFRTRGTNALAMAVRSPSAMVFNLGEVPKSGHAGKAPATRMGTAALIRNALTGAANARRKRDAAAKGEPPGADPKRDALEMLLEGKIPAVFSAHRADDLATSLRLSEEFRLRCVLDLATEGYLIAGRIAEAKIPVLVHPTMQRIGGAPETMHSALTNAASLADHGIPIAITSGYEGYVPKTRTPLYEAAVAMANGLGYERALRAVTLDAAKILGINDRFGSLEVGKAGDVVLFDGDPFEYATHVTHVLMDGQVAYDRAAAQSRPNAGLGQFGGEPNCCLGGY